MKKRDSYAIIAAIVTLACIVSIVIPIQNIAFAKKAPVTSSKKTTKTLAKKTAKKSTVSKKKTSKKKVKKSKVKKRAEKLTIDPPLIDPDNPPGGVSAY